MGERPGNPKASTRGGTVPDQVAPAEVIYPPERGAKVPCGTCGGTGERPDKPSPGTRWAMPECSATGPANVTGSTTTPGQSDTLRPVTALGAMMGGHSGHDRAEPGLSMFEGVTAHLYGTPANVEEMERSARKALSATGAPQGVHTHPRTAGCVRGGGCFVLRHGWGLVER